MSATLGYGPRSSPPYPVKSLLLTYDAAGTLRRVWAVNPYVVRHVAADAQGDVFALGEKGSVSTPYPLLIKYSPTGEVLHESLSTALFSAKEAVVESASANGEAEIVIKNDRVFVWIAATQELFVFSMDGVFISKTSLVPAIQKMEEQSAAYRVRVLSLWVDSDQGILSQVQLWSKERKAADVALARVAPDGSFENWVEPISRGDIHRFLGLTADDEKVFLEKVSPRIVKIDLK